MEACQGNKLEDVPHLADRLLKSGDSLSIELFAPIERGRAVVCQHFSRELLMDRFSEPSGLFDAWFGSLAPDQIAVGSVGKPARDCRIKAPTRAEEALRRAFSGEETMVGGIDIGG